MATRKFCHLKFLLKTNQYKMNTIGKKMAKSRELNNIQKIIYYLKTDSIGFSDFAKLNFYAEI